VHLIAEVRESEARYDDLEVRSVAKTRYDGPGAENDPKSVSTERRTRSVRQKGILRVEEVAYYYSVNYGGLALTSSGTACPHTGQRAHQQANSAWSSSRSPGSVSRPPLFGGGDAARPGGTRRP
jgi:hypothetical protein